MKRIFITGGHFAPALAVIQKLRAKRDWQIFYVGRRFAMEGEKAEALEYRELSNLSDLRYLSILTGRLQRRFFVRPGQSVRAFLKVFVGFGQALFWLIKYRPQVVLSFGGYVAVPIVIVAWLLNIPVVTHEQALVPGLANKIIARFADKICVSWADTVNLFPENKTVLTGNPIREEIIVLGKRIKNYELGVRGRKPWVYITGGSQGAHVINLAVEEVLPKLLEKFTVIHQTGEAREFGDFERLANDYKNYNCYKVYKFLPPEEAAQVLGKADLVVSRAGANIVTELAFLGKPAILVPIPQSSGNEQYLNAKMLADAGMAEILEQKDLTGENLYKLILRMSQNIEQYREKAPAAQRLIIPDAVEKVVSVLACLPQSHPAC